jgi:hypothetical protein
MPNDSVNIENTHKNLSAEYMRKYRKHKAQDKAQENKTSQAGNSHAAYMRGYRKRMRVEKDICNNAPKRTKLNAERQHDYRNAKLRKIKHHKRLRQLTLHQLQLYTIIIKRMNTFKRMLLVIYLVMPATYALDYGI